MALLSQCDHIASFYDGCQRVRRTTNTRVLYLVLLPDDEDDDADEVHGPKSERKAYDEDVAPNTQMHTRISRCRDRW